MMNRTDRYIPYGRQTLEQEDVQAVIDVLRSDWLTQGPMVPRFERAIADYCGSRHAVAVNSATSALHLACLALGLGPGDWLWTSPNTFVASANCGLYCSASVDFVDIDPLSYNMSVAALSAKLEEAEHEGKLPKVVVPVQFGGQSCDMRAIRQLSERYGFRIVEDASHAIGGTYLGEPVGKCRYSDIAVFSFHPVKVITTGEGGMAVTNDAELARRMARLRTHGITREQSEMVNQSDGPWYYEQLDLGYNYRMTDIQAALGLSQFGRLDDYVRRRHEIAERYDRLLADLPIMLPHRAQDVHSALHLYVIRVRHEKASKSRGQVFRSLRSAGIGVNVHYIPVHMQPQYRRLGFNAGDFPEAERYYSEAITLPLYPALTGHEQDHVVSSLRAAVLLKG